MAKRKMTMPKSVDSLSDNSLIGGLMVIITIVVSISIVLTRVWIADIKFNKKVIDAKNQVNNTLKHNVDALNDLKTNFTTMQTNGVLPSQVLQALPLSIAYDDFSNSIEAVAALSGVALHTVTLSIGTANTSTTGPQVAQVNLSVVGTYQNLQHFLKNLQSTDRPIVINTLAIAGTGKQVGLQLTATTFYQPLTTTSPQSEVLSE